MNILDILKEWNEHPDLGPKELEELEVGLDFERYVILSERLEAFVSEPHPRPILGLGPLGKAKFKETNNPRTRPRGKYTLRPNAYKYKKC